MNMQTSPSDSTGQEILQELHHLNEKMDNVSADLRGEIASLDRKMDSSFSNLNNKIESIHAETLEALHIHADQTDAHFMLVDNRLTRVESRMVTKDYLDDKLADQYSKIVEHTTRKIEKALG